MTERKIYTAEFKREAVRLAQQPDLGITRTARDLGISLSALNRWIKADQQEGEQAFPGRGRQHLTPEQEEIKRLRRDLKIVREERELLEGDELGRKPRNAQRSTPSAPRETGRCRCAFD
ncbi:transposase [Deinococcus sp. Arct2-2]|uniref:transposase n=1 Tax=Deinococcus sp. Arct2-2 TaxID=2568653 RepID=UPI0010A3F971|nr:transposase [Deinococcus sp. Arct2-2]THF67921.1 transposase [Deinococcus sp. Arct2-2]